MRGRIDRLSLQDKIALAAAVVVVLIGGAFALGSILDSGSKYESACRASVEQKYGYSASWQGSQINACVETAKSFEQQGVSQESIRNELGLP